MAKRVRRRFRYLLWETSCRLQKLQLVASGFAKLHLKFLRRTETCFEPRRIDNRRAPAQPRRRSGRTFAVPWSAVPRPVVLSPNLSPLFAPFRPYSPQKNMEPSKKYPPASPFSRPPTGLNGTIRSDPDPSRPEAHSHTIRIPSRRREGGRDKTGLDAGATNTFHFSASALHSIDRTIAEYAEDIWHAKLCPVD